MFNTSSKSTRHFFARQLRGSLCLNLQERFSTRDGIFKSRTPSLGGEGSHQKSSIYYCMAFLQQQQLLYHHCTLENNCSWSSQSWQSSNKEKKSLLENCQSGFDLEGSKYTNPSILDLKTNLVAPKLRRCEIWTKEKGIICGRTVCFESHIPSCTSFSFTFFLPYLSSAYTCLVYRNHLFECVLWHILLCCFIGHIWCSVINFNQPAFRGCICNCQASFKKTVIPCDHLVRPTHKRWKCELSTSFAQGKVFFAAT